MITAADRISAGILADCDGEITYEKLYETALRRLESEVEPIADDVIRGLMRSDIRRAIGELVESGVISRIDGGLPSRTYRVSLLGRLALAEFDRERTDRG